MLHMLSSTFFRKLQLNFIYLRLIITAVTAVIISIPGFASAQNRVTANKVIIYPMPKGEAPNTTYKIFVSGKTVPVYSARVGAADPARRFKAVDDLMHSADYFDTAAFAYFDMQGTAPVRVQINGAVRSVTVLPTSAAIKPLINGNSISFTARKPQNLTIEINGETVKSLHLFINPPETNRPSPNDPNVIFYGPGLHELTSLVVGDNKTLYVAGGAIVRTVIGKEEKFDVEPAGIRNYPPSIILAGRNVKLKGRGIIDAGLLPTHSRNMVFSSGNGLSLEGVILRNTSAWTMHVYKAANVSIDNIKILGYRANSDGIDISNSRNVVVNNCFVRTNDDLVVVKSWEGQGRSEHIIVQNCVLWNQLAHALSLGAELREDVNDVVFKNCDIIHDTGREWSLRIFHSDSSRISNIVFQNIRIEESHRFISLWTGKNVHSSQKKYGTIENVTFKDIKVTGQPLSIELIGGDNDHSIKNVVFKNVTVNNKPLNNAGVGQNPFVKGLMISR